MNGTNEGYEIIASETYHVSTITEQESRVVLARKETTFGTMFVTWESNALLISQSCKKVDYYWGHYFDDENKARADYHKRLAAKYEG